MVAKAPPAVLERLLSEKLTWRIGLIALYIYLRGCTFICRPDAKFLGCILRWRWPAVGVSNAIKGRGEGRCFGSYIDPVSANVFVILDAL